MVRIGVICEGETEKIIVDSDKFAALLESLGLTLVISIDANGNGNLLPKNIGPFIQILQDAGAQRILILSDLDTDKCITITKERISAPPNIDVVISVKKIESWFLADSDTLTDIFKGKFIFENPEAEIDPRETLKQIFLEKTLRGIPDSKPRFAKFMVKNGFSISNAADHANCNSAKYLINKLKK